MSTLATPQTGLLAVLGVVGLCYAWMLARSLQRRRAQEPAAARAPTAGGLGTGFVTAFFDTLGIGSYAPTTAIFRFWKMVPDEQIPGTLNVGHVLAALIQAFIFIRAVSVEPLTLTVLIASASLGAWLGAGLVASWPRRRIQVGMGLAMASAAALMLLGLLQQAPVGGEALGLSGWKLIFGAIVNGLLGALMTIGIGLYAPCMILLSFLGMSPITAFPVMMGSCAFLMPVASARFIRDNCYNVRAALGLLLGGVPAVLIAAFIVKSLPLGMLRWLVVVVVMYTAAGLLRSAWSESRRPA